MSKSVLTLGTFDGVHRGHQALIRKVVHIAKSRKLSPVALAFDMPPRHAGKPFKVPVLLSTWAEKKQFFSELGIKRLIPLRFDRKTARTTAEDFFHDVLLRKWSASEIVVGPKLAFGFRRAGNLALLRKLGKNSGVRVHVVQAVGKSSHTVSSRVIRAALTNGHLDRANTLLGYPYAIEGTVIHGDHRGRRLGFPTANLRPQSGKIMPPGVYWVKVLKPGASVFKRQHLKKAVDGLCNVGFRPTFHPKEHTLHCEVHVLNRSGSFYGRTLRVVFMRKIRAEMKFSSPAALICQIQKDRMRARLYKKAHFSI